jgi:hypothetical protein
MRLKSFVMSAIFAGTVFTSFAFNKPQQTAYFEPKSEPWACVEGETTTGPCSAAGKFAQCTCYDPNSSSLVPAYFQQNTIYGGCQFPLYLEY